MTNARFASLHGRFGRPRPLSTTPAPLRKPRARHERISICRSGGGFRLRLGFATLRCGLHSAMRSFPSSAPLPLSESQTEANVHRRAWRESRRDSA